MESDTQPERTSPAHLPAPQFANVQALRETKFRASIGLGAVFLVFYEKYKLDQGTDEWNKKYSIHGSTNNIEKQPQVHWNPLTNPSSTIYSSGGLWGSIEEKESSNAICFILQHQMEITNLLSTFQSLLQNLSIHDNTPVSEYKNRISDFTRKSSDNRSESDNQEHRRLKSVIRHKFPHLIKAWETVAFNITPFVAESPMPPATVPEMAAHPVRPPARENPPISPGPIPPAPEGFVENAKAIATEFAQAVANKLAAKEPDIPVNNDVIQPGQNTEAVLKKDIESKQFLLNRMVYNMTRPTQDSTNLSNIKSGVFIDDPADGDTLITLIDVK